MSSTVDVCSHFLHNVLFFSPSNVSDEENQDGMFESVETEDSESCDEIQAKDEIKASSPLCDSSDKPTHNGALLSDCPNVLSCLCCDASQALGGAVAGKCRAAQMD